MRDPLKPVIISGRLSILYEVGIDVPLGRHPVLDVNDLPRVLILVIPLLLNHLIGRGRLLRSLFDVFFIILTFISPTGRPFLKNKLSPAVKCTLTQLFIYALLWG